MGFAEVSNSVVNISGGSVGDSFDALDSEVNISGGFVRDHFDAVGSVVNISGGFLGNNFIANSGSVVNISGGTLGISFRAEAGSLVNISGGTLGDNFDAEAGSVVNISGGIPGEIFEAFAGSEVNLFGSEFFIDGLPMDNLLLDQAFTITDRDVTLSGLLADGEPFSFRINSVDQPFRDFFEPGSTLTVTLTSPVTLLGDVNLDGVVDFLDIAPFIALLSSETFQAEADIDVGCFACIKIHAATIDHAAIE